MFDDFDTQITPEETREYQEYQERQVRIAPAVECNDGFSMSVQASQNHYCAPRNNEGPYTHLEVGFPSESEELLLPFAEDDTEPTKTVYGWVPIEVIEAVIAKHGGRKE